MSDRVELVGFVEPDLERRVKANLKWGVPSYDNVPIALEALKPDIVSVCVQPEGQAEIINRLDLYEDGLRGVWCEKPYVSRKPQFVPVQVNYMRRGDTIHQKLADYVDGGKLIVYAKDDIHTKCHFEDLAKWWKATLDYRTFNGPCSYLYRTPGMGSDIWFDNGGVDGGTCFKAMLENLLDHVDTGAPLWSPPR
jgi:predicted dehydrogenase